MQEGGKKRINLSCFFSLQRIEARVLTSFNFEVLEKKRNATIPEKKMREKSDTESRITLYRLGQSI